MFGVRMNLDGLNGFQGRWLSVKEVVTYQLKNIEQDIREISMI
jgi:hypothetical protein